MQHGKRYNDARAMVDREQLYSPGEAIKLLKNLCLLYTSPSPRD